MWNISDWASVKRVIRTRSNSTVLNLNSSINLVASDNQTVISAGKHVTLVGNGHTIDAGGHETSIYPYYVGGVCNFFDVYEGASLTLVGPLTLKGGNAPDSKGGMVAGGGAIWMHGGTLVATQVVFDGNVASYGYGGAITVVFKNTVLDFTDCVFDSNFALYGGAIAIYNSAHAKMKNCKFKKNGYNPAASGQTADTGGAINVEGEGSQLQIDSFGLFADNEAEQGLAIYANLKTSVEFSACAGAAQGGLAYMLTKPLLLDDCATTDECCALLAKIYAEISPDNDYGYIVLIVIISIVAAVGFALFKKYQRKVMDDI
jgi:hypothetical protein